MKYLLTILCGLLFSCWLRADTIELRAGMTIKSSVTISPGTYPINVIPGSPDAVITIEGNDIVVDFNHAILQGSNNKLPADEFYGWAIRIKKGAKNITIRNAVVHGYKIGLMAEQVTNLTIENSDMGYNWRQRLYSGREKEDTADRLDLRNNEHDDWLHYGAGIYLKNCRKGILKGNTINGGQCALMMTGCEQIEAYDNNFSFNSGIGIGLYRSSNNKIYHNQLDYNIRGYSAGKYTHSQGSAGLLLFEQSSNNTIAFNSATHCGEGLFLSAGQSTLNTGKAGSNDNFIYGNDFSYAATNGVEINFSHNLLMKNTISHCDTGIRGEYSIDTDITDNQFSNNHIAIALENGQNMNIALNSFSEDSMGIRLSSREPADPPYTKGKNIGSLNYWIAANRFINMPVAYAIAQTDTVVFSGNSKMNVAVNFRLGQKADNIDSSLEDETLDMDYQPDARLSQLKYKELPAVSIPTGKENIRLTEWGPYNFQYPLLWLQDVDSGGVYHFQVLGPKGNWEIGLADGFDIISKGENTLPSTLLAKPDTQKTGRVLQLIYKGGTFSDAFGKKIESIAEYRFEYREYPMNKE